MRRTLVVESTREACMERVDSPWSCVTVDLHTIDLPEDIEYASEWLAGAGVPATFFIPSSLLLEPRYTRALRGLPGLGHEVASHSHEHDWAEIEALAAGRGLAFLATSHTIHADFFQRPPRSFRAPLWGTLAPATVSELARLGYEVDSSATPQRIPLLSSRPFSAGWLTSPRGLHPLAPGLLEIPTSTLFVPAGGSTFLILKRASHVLIRLLELEARWARDRALVLQLHVDELNPGSRRVRGFGPLTWEDFTLRRRGGVGFKYALIERDSARIAPLHHALVRRLAAMRCVTLASLADAWRLRATGANGSVTGDMRPAVR